MNKNLLRSLLCVLLLSLCIGKGFADPGGLTATPVSASQINLSWSESPDQWPMNPGYYVSRIVGNAWTLIGIVPGGGFTFSDTGLSPSTTYTYQVTGVYMVGAESYS